MANNPLCFVLMPFGIKTLPDNRTIDFNYVYLQLIKPAILAAGLEPIRADEEKTDGIIHKPMFERLVLCEYAVADLSASNTNVFYELGVRHAAKPHTTTLLFEGTNRLPFDVNMLRGLPYFFETNGTLKDLEATKQLLVDKLQAAKTRKEKDSPVFQLMTGFPDIDLADTDIFRKQVDYAQGIKTRLRNARNVKSLAEINAIEKELGNLADVDAGILVDLFLAYRSVEAYKDMIRLVRTGLPATVSNTVMIREQFAFALNREDPGSAEASDVLNKLIEDRGGSSETYGILGRVYKDRWIKIRNHPEQRFEAAGLLDEAVEVYYRGFMLDLRDIYPGVNAVTLMELKDTPDKRQLGLLPVVRFAAEQKLLSRKPVYWDHATLLELAIIERQPAVATDALRKAIPLIDEKWQPKSTLDNLQLIRAAREQRGEDAQWQLVFEKELQKKVPKDD